MAIRILLILFFSFSVFARYENVIKLYNQKKYNESIEALKKLEGRVVRKYSNNALLLLAKNFQKQEKFKESIKIYFYLLKKAFPKTDKKVRAVLKSAGDIESIGELPDGQKKIYLELLDLYVEIYEKQQLQNFKDTIAKYSELLYFYDYKVEVVEKLNARILSKDKLEIDLKVNTKFYVGIGYALWHDNLDLVSPSGSISTINSTAEGTTFIFGWTKGNNFGHWRYEGFLTQASATVGENSTNFQYFQTNVKEVMLGMNIGYQWKTSDNISSGFTVPMLYRTGDFTQPDTFELKNANMLSVGLAANFNWDFYKNEKEENKLSLDFKFGKLYNFKSTYSVMSLYYQF